MNKIRLHDDLYLINLSALNDVAAAVVNEEQQCNYEHYAASGNYGRQQRCKNGCYASVVNGTNEGRCVRGPGVIVCTAVTFDRSARLCGWETATTAHAAAAVVDAVKVEAAVREAALCVLAVAACNS